MSPYPYRLISAPAADLLPVRAPVDGVHLVLVAREVHDQLPRADVPHLQRRVFRGGDEESGVGGEAALVDRGNMAA